MHNFLKIFNRIKMEKHICFCIIFIQILALSSTTYQNTNTLSLEINRAKSHEDLTGEWTPLVVTIYSSDITEKIKDVDLICVVDVSGSMEG